jgi:hypothetical protein
MGQKHSLIKYLYLDLQVLTSENLPALRFAEYRETVQNLGVKQQLEKAVAV